MKNLLYILLFVPLALFGQENYSLSFDGVDDEVVFDNALQDDMDEITIMFHTKLLIASGVIISDWPSSGGCFKIDFGNSDAIRFDFITSGGYFSTSHIITPNDFNTWISWACTYDAEILKIYKNGVLVESNPLVTGTISPSSSEIRFANEENNPGFWNGNMDNPSFWNEALTEQQIQSYMICPPSGNEEALLGYWNFNEGTGDTVYDISGNGNHGVINGATFSEDVPENNCVEGCIDTLAINYNDTANVDDGSCVSVEEYTIDSLEMANQALLEESSLALSSLQQALDTWNTTIDLSSGWNMFGYGCPSPIDVAEGLSNHTESILITKDNNGAVYMPEFGFNGIGDFTPGFGYQIKVTEAIESFSLCDWYVNDIPEDNIVSLQEEVEDLTLEIKCLTNPEIGDNCFGGVIFYYDSNDDKGIIVSQAQVAATQWGCYETEILGANGTAIGTGLQNTLDIVAGCSEQPIAASECLDYENEGFDDWYLPSIDELLLIYSNVGPQSMYDLEFQFNFHWSSTEIDSNIADDFHFGLPNSYTGNVKNGGSYVRAIRYFGNWTEGCIDEAACNYNSEVNLPNSTLCDYVQEGFDCDGNELIPYQVGDMTEGGIVFYVDDSGQHGLVAALEDLGLFEWGCFNIEVDGADGTGIGSGYLNSLEIVAECVETPIAASEALAFESGDYSDWYLPSKDELIEMYFTIGNGGTEGNIGDFVLNVYMSSSEYSIYSIWVVGLDNGFSGPTPKSNLGIVRPIRSF